MFRNYIVIALRIFGREKLLSAINVAGLSVGIACCALLLLFVADELTFDQVHARADRIYRMARVSLTPDGGDTDTPVTPWMPIPAGPTLAAEMPEVEAFVRLKRNELLVRKGEATAEEPVVFADASVFDVFTFPLLAGDSRTALARPDGVVLSEAAAHRYFGALDPIGRPLDVRLAERFEAFTVTGVAAVPANSTVRFEVLLPFERAGDTYPFMRRTADTFKSSSVLTYVLLRDGTSIADVEAKLPAFVGRHYGDVFEELRAGGFWTAAGHPLAYRLQPLLKIHLDPGVQPGLTRPSRPIFSFLLTLIGLAVLLIAAINFVTLTLGRSTYRAREVGVRKAVGADRSQIAGQFWAEALIYGVVALALGAALALLFLPAFSELTGKELSAGLAGGAWWPIVLVAVALAAGLAAGSYPALLLANLHPVDALRNRVRVGGKGYLGRGLVALQFAVTVFLLSGTFVIAQQLRHLQRHDLGYDRDHVAVIRLNNLDGERVLAGLRESSRRSPDVIGITGISASFGAGTSSYGFTRGGDEVEVFVYRVEHDFVDVMGMELLAGRDFDLGHPSDSTGAVIVNQSLAARMGWHEPVGEIFSDFEWDEVQSPAVIGLVRDFNFQSLHGVVEPAVLTLDPGSSIQYALARLQPGRTSEALSALKSSWEGAVPDLPFDYRFLEDDLAAFYETEVRWSRIVRYATALALLVACLGLFGLAVLAVSQRTREIGIRKVLGAHTSDLILWLSRGFAVPVLVGAALGMPLAYLAADRWLEDFAYRITLGPGIFLLAGGAALAIALLTVGYHAIRAATADPVNAIRAE